MDNLQIQNALSRSLGIEIDEESACFISATSRGSTGFATLREDVHHLLVDIKTLPQYWLETLRYELRKLEYQEFGLLKFCDDEGVNDRYIQFCRNLDPALVKIDTANVRFSCVEIKVNDNHNIRIVLRDNATPAA